MSRLRLTDILCELVDLSHDRVTEIRQQLVYYRASVYKDETASYITVRIDQMRVLAELLADDPMLEAFKDYDAMATAGIMHFVPGECSFSTRVARLLAEVTPRLERMHQQIVTRGAEPEIESQFAATVRKHRTQLLALCREGTRQWAFFEAL
jgi:hypothetical protein